MHTWKITTSTGEIFKRFKENNEYTRLNELVKNKEILEEFKLITPMETVTFQFPEGSTPDFFSRVRITQKGNESINDRWWFYGYTKGEEKFYLVFNEKTFKVTTLVNSTLTPE